MSNEVAERADPAGALVRISFSVQNYLKSETVTLCACALFYSFLGTDVWIALFAKSGFLSMTNIGLLASGEQVAMALGTLVVAMGGLRASPRKLVAGAAGAVALANLLAIIPTVPTVVVGRLVNGAAIGVITAVQWRVAGDRSDAQRTFSLMVGTLIVSGAAYMGLLVPYLVPRFGAPGLFAVLVVTGLVVGALAYVSLPSTTARPSTPQSPSGWRVNPALLGCLGLTAVASGVLCIGDYGIVIGTGLGFKFSSLTKALGVTGLLAVLGPAAAHWLGERAGLLLPLLGALVFVAIAPLVMVRAPWLLLFVGAMGVSSAAMCFYLPYATALISRIDVSRRFISAASLFQMIGNATGPAFGGTLMAHSSARAVAVAATGLVGTGMILFSLAGHFGSPKRNDLRNEVAMAPDDA